MKYAGLRRSICDIYLRECKESCMQTCKTDYAGALPPKVSVLGAGALGSIYGAYLSEGGCEVTLIVRRAEEAQAINSGGLCLRRADGCKTYTRARAVFHISETPAPDLLLFLVKGPDTAEAAAGAAPYIPAGCTLLTLQNGLGNVEKISEFIPAHQIIAGVSYTGGTRIKPGEVMLGGVGPTIIGEMDSKMTPRLRRVAELIGGSGLPVQISENIQGHIWTKAIVNAAINPLAALTRLSNGRLAACEESRRLMRQLAEEGAQVASMLGIRLETDDPAAYALAVAENTGSNSASMLQDILNSRATEIESINGAIATMARKGGLETPLNRAITDMIRLLEKSSLT